MGGEEGVLVMSSRGTEGVGRGKEEGEGGGGGAYMEDA
jgi:hypothetical protein